MARKKQQKKRLKKYKGKYVTADRLDMSTGGRVKAAVGGIQQAPMSRKKPSMSIEREEEPMVSTPSTTKQPTFTQAPIESKRPDVVQPQETFIENLDTAANNIDTTFRQAPTTGKGSDQMFIGREGEVRPAMSVKDIEDGRIGDERNEPKDPPNGQATIVRQGFIYAWNGFTYVNTNQRASTDTDTEQKIQIQNRYRAKEVVAWAEQFPRGGGLCGACYVLYMCRRAFAGEPRVSVARTWQSRVSGAHT